jgi:hypothetical protein
VKFPHLAELWRTLVGSGPELRDGYGQSLLDDIASARRFSLLKRDAITWQPPGSWPGRLEDDFPILNRFGDGALCWSSGAGENRIVIDRMWHGWPDPPEFAVFAFDVERRIVWATDFDYWPERWERPPVAKLGA